MPHRHTLYAAQVITQKLYGKVISALRELAGGGLIMQPSSVRDFANPELAALIKQTQQSPAADARSKVKFGARTRLLRFRPGARTTEQFVHDYWEEVFLVSGDLTVGSSGGERETFTAHTYACRPPGVLHGPFESAGGCLLLESHYYTA